MLGLELFSAKAYALSGTYNGTLPSGWTIDDKLGLERMYSLNPYTTSFVGNTLNLVGGSLYTFGNVYPEPGYGSATAAYTHRDYAYGNTLNMSGGSFNIVYGVFSPQGDLSNNSVNVTGGEARRAFAAFTNQGDAYNNSVTVSGGLIHERIFVGRSAQGDSYNNLLTITGGTINTNATAGRSKSGTVYNNTVNISGGTILGMASAARSNGTASVRNNTIEVTGGTFDYAIAGAYALKGTASNNSVKVLANSLQAPTFISKMRIWGAYTNTGTMDSNSVEIIGADLSEVEVAGAISTDSGILSNNTVRISNNTLPLSASSIITNANTAIYGAYNPKGTSTNNSVYIQSGTYNGIISGAHTQSGNANGNSVTLNGGTFEANSISSGASTSSGNLKDNTLIINGGTFKANSIVSAVRGHSLTDNASLVDNTLVINGGNFETNSIIAGTYFDAGSSAYKSSGSKIIVNGNVDLSKAIVMGAIDSNGVGHSQNLHNDNTLVINSKATAKAVYNFKNFELYVRNHNDVTSPMLETESIHFGEGANVTAYLGDHADTLEMGQEINLFQVTDPNGAEGSIASAQAVQGMSIINHLDYNEKAGNLVFAVTGYSAHPHSITFPEARLASFAFLNQSDDLALGQGMAAALAAAENVQAKSEVGENILGESAGSGNYFLESASFENSKENSAWQAFAAFDGGAFSYDTRSSNSDGDIKYSGVSALFGISRKFILGENNLLIAPYIEIGSGQISTHSSISDATQVQTDGTSDFYGGGLMLRYDRPINLATNVFNLSSESFYISTLMRAGALFTDFDTKGELYSLSYDTHTAYYGLGLTLGYQIAFENSFLQEDSIDFYLRYMWTQLSENEQYLDSQKYTFDAINSHQVRAGFQYNRAFSKMLTLSFGMAAQCEFDGESNAKIRDSIKVNSTDFAGVTGLFEIGARISPSANSPLSFGASAEGMIGVRSGGSFTLDFQYSF